MAECAYQEIEVWALAAADLPKDWTWDDIRDHRHPKEEYFDPVAKQRNLQMEPGQGRQTLGSEAGKNIERVLKRCPELQHIARRISSFIENNVATGEPFEEPPKS